MNASSIHLGKVVVEPIDTDVKLTSLLRAAVRFRDPVLLESSLTTTPHSRYSILAIDPVTCITLPAHGPDPFQWMRDHLGPSVGTVGADGRLPFVGGWVGFLTYELGALARPRLDTPRQDPGLPLARFALYDTAAVLDHVEGRWYAVGADITDGDFPRRPPVRDRLQAVRALLMASSQCSEESSPTPVSSPASPSLGRPDFLRRVEEVKRYIRAGDVYQVNLTQRFDATTDATPEALYARLRHFSPSGHAAFLRFDDAAIISSSPELFLHLRDRVVTTRPIKGTRPRTGHPAIDDGRRRELAKSAKDRAELAMIVDLLRNDLGRVCEFGSVRVEHEGAIEMHPTVLHRVATISGRLREDADWCDLLAATFPCGSVTGAPKIRAMQIIDELEPTARGVYCGAIGYVGLDGAAQFNVAIRTMVYQGGAVQLYAGSGIVADSVAEHEYDETLAKARGMMLALNTNLAGGSPLAEAAIA